MSSNYIVVLPDNFKLKTENRVARKIFNFLKKTGSIGFASDCKLDGISEQAWGDGCDELNQLLEAYVVRNIEVDSLNSGIDLIFNNDIRKSWGINENS